MKSFIGVPSVIAAPHFNPPTHMLVRASMGALILLLRLPGILLLGNLWHGWLMLQLQLNMTLGTSLLHIASRCCLVALLPWCFCIFFQCSLPFGVSSVHFSGLFLGLFSGLFFCSCLGPTTPSGSLTLPMPQRFYHSQHVLSQVLLSSLASPGSLIW